MSENSTSHTQWIQYAVAAAKAGNPSVAKIQLQKAAEENPEDPAIWLWLGWLVRILIEHGIIHENQVGSVSRIK